MIIFKDIFPEIYHQLDMIFGCVWKWGNSPTIAMGVMVHQWMEWGLFSDPNIFWLVVWNIFYFSHHIGNRFPPTDFHSIIFQRGRPTTNQSFSPKKMGVWQNWRPRDDPRPLRTDESLSWALPSWPRSTRLAGGIRSAWLASVWLEDRGEDLVVVIVI